MSTVATPYARVRRSGVVRILTGRWALVALAAAAGIGLRVWVYGALLGAPDSDEAIVGLMIRHALHGQITTFYWDQPYGGSQEVLLGVPVFAAFGSGLLQLRVIPMTLYAVAAVIVWRVGLRTVGERAAVAAGALLWVWPPYSLVHVTREYGFYASGLVYCGLLLLLALRIDELPSRARVAWFGLVLGLAFWQTAQIIPIAVVAIAWVAVRRPTALRHLWVGLLAAVLGALPWLVWNVRHDWGSILPHSTLAAYRQGLRLFASPLFPMALGLRAPLTDQLLMPKVLVYLVYVSLLVLFVVTGWRKRHERVSLVYAVALAFPFLLVLSRKATSNTSDPRFLIVLTPVLALLLSQLAGTYLRGLALVAVGCVVTVVCLHRLDGWYATHERVWPLRTPRSLAPLISTLDRLHVRNAYAEYWIAYRVAFDSGEHIIVVDNPLTGTEVANGRLRPTPASSPHSAEYERQVDRASRFAVVTFRNLESTEPAVAQLRQHGFRRVVVGPFAVYAPAQR
jgi:4-amino-4-deoxy-L-arabinose transferase-like glycosyltransferase